MHRKRHTTFRSDRSILWLKKPRLIVSTPSSASGIKASKTDLMYDSQQIEQSRRGLVRRLSAPPKFELEIHQLYASGSVWFCYTMYPLGNAASVVIEKPSSSTRLPFQF